MRETPFIECIYEFARQVRGDGLHIHISLVCWEATNMSPLQARPGGLTRSFYVPNSRAFIVRHVVKFDVRKNSSC
jgi:hypothetical protein